MKQYGANKATEFTRRQINVIFAKAKKGDLRVEKWFMSELYNLAEYYGYDCNRNVEASEQKVLRILEHVFAGDLEKAQEEIDSMTEQSYSLSSRKNQKSFDRSYIA